MVLKVHNVDGSTKMVAIHEVMNARDVCILLAERNHQEIGPNWTLVEKLTDLYLGMSAMHCLVLVPESTPTVIVFIGIAASAAMCELTFGVLCMYGI
jgi:hypothetical protein